MWLSVPQSAELCLLEGMAEEGSWQLGGEYYSLEYFKELISEREREDDDSSRFAFVSDHLKPSGARNLVEALSLFTHRFDLDLVYNGLGQEGCTVVSHLIGQNPFLEGLTIQYNEVDDFGLLSMSNELALNQTLIRLNLGCNAIGCEGMRSLASALRFNGTLESLIIQYNPLGDEGARHVAEALAVMSTLKELDISGCGIASQGAKDISEALRLNESLIYLDFNDNPIQDDGVIHIADVLCSSVTSALASLDLHGCGIGDNGAVSLARVLHNNTSLLAINLDSNCISDAGIAAISNGLRSKVTQITHLDVSHNRFSHAGAEFLADSLRFNSTLVEVKGIDLHDFVTSVFRFSQVDVMTIDDAPGDRNGAILQLLRRHREDLMK